MACGLALLLAAGCGEELDDPPATDLETSTTVPEAATDAEPTTTSTSTTSTSETASGPAGPLLANGVGDVKQGTSVVAAIDLFGQPAGREQFPGCELDPESSPIVQLSYELGDGSLYLNFDAARDELVSYRTDSSELATALVDRVGESFESVRANWGSSLEPLAIGAPATPKSGAWAVEDSPTSQLIFTIEDGTVRSISGGYLPPCE